MKTIVTAILVLYSFYAIGQYHPDRHNTSYDAGWLSCERKESPNADRPLSHWIMYDFSQIYQLGKTTFWNYNAGKLTDNGVKEIVIDYSLDGITWIEYGAKDIKQAEASGFYTGEEGPDLTGINARYLLITAVSNYGGDCVGFSEIRFQTNGIISDVDDLSELPVSLKALPNPFLDKTIIEVGSLEKGNYRYQVTNLSGQVLWQKSVFLSDDSEQILISLNSAPTGIYLFTLSDGKRAKTLRIEKMDK